VVIQTTNLNGSYAKDIQIETNDPDKKEVTLTIRATVKEVLSVLPRVIVFSPPDQGTKQTRELSLTNASKAPISILGMEAEPAEVFKSSFQGEVSLNPGQKKVFFIVYNPDKGAGGVQGSITLRTNMKEISELKVPVIIASDGKIQSRPE
jgi:hypothetical protein